MTPLFRFPDTLKLPNGKYTNKQTQGLLELSSATSALTSPAGGAINLSQLQNDQQQTKQDFK